MGVDAHDAVSTLVQSHFGARDVLLTSSGTAALTLAIAATLRVARGPIALPGYACYDLATAADGADAKVVLYDLDPETLAPEPASLARALAHQPCALVIVHQYGIPVDVEAITAQAAATGTLVIEDAAQAVGASVRGAPCGSLGPVSVLSFGRGKGLTGGAGGALLANDAAGERIVRLARGMVRGTRSGWSELLRTAAQWVLARPSLYGIPAALPFLRLGETLYHPPSPPQTLSHASAHILREVWSASVRASTTRRAHAIRLLAAADLESWAAVQPVPETAPGYLRLPLRTIQARDAVLDSRARRLGIMPGYPLPLAELPRFRDRCVNRTELPGARLLATSLITLPTHELLTEDDLTALERWLGQPRVMKPSSGGPAPREVTHLSV